MRATTANPQAATHSIRRPQITGPQAARAQHQNPRRVPATTTRCSGRKGRGYRSADQRAATPTMHNPQGCNRRTPQAARAQRQEPIRPQGTAAESRRPQAKREQPPGRQNRLQEHNPPGHRPQGTIKPPGHKAHTANSQQHPPAAATTPQGARAPSRCRSTSDTATTPPRGPGHRAGAARPRTASTTHTQAPPANTPHHPPVRPHPRNLLDPPPRSTCWRLQSTRPRATARTTAVRSSAGDRSPAAV